ncbi:MAG: hypothetical protein RIC55_05765 [Pirellulaceae bacterium]
MQLFVFCIGVRGFAAEGDEQRVSQDKRPLPASKARLEGVGRDVTTALLSDDFELREQAIAGVVRDRKELIKQLCAVVAEPTNCSGRPEAVRGAITLLGELRAKEAVDVLVDHLAFPDVAPKGAGPPRLVTDARDLYPTRDRLPAIKALIAIGEPGVDRLVEKLASPRNHVEFEACLIVLKALEKPSVRAKVRGVSMNAAPARRRIIEQSFGLQSP